MAKPYSGDLREAVVRAVTAGRSCAEVAGIFHISKRSAERYVALWRATGSVASHAKFGGHKKPRLAEHAAIVEALIAGQPEMTLEAIKDALAKEKIKVGLTAIFSFLKRSGYSYKKNTGRGRAKAEGRGGTTRRLAGASEKA